MTRFRAEFADSAMQLPPCATLVNPSSSAAACLVSHMNSITRATQRAVRLARPTLPRMSARSYADYKGPTDTVYFTKELPSESFRPEEFRAKGSFFSQSLLVTSVGSAALFALAAAVISLTTEQPKPEHSDEKKDSSTSTASQISETKDSAENNEAPESAASKGSIDPENPNAPAFDPETGKINWDCPCLGGMAYGVCGTEFREAFSCFVYSEAEPQGSDCIEKFKGMQECFRAHPEIYERYLADDEDEDDDLAELVAEAEVALDYE